jgi:alkylation response protein AidB-like acyl-CoA dehydrogenase
MELLLTVEQSLIRDSAAKFAAEAGPKVARQFRWQHPAFSRQRLHHAAELGWLSILVPESFGGLGLGLSELALVLEQVGRGLVCEPIGLAAITAFALASGDNPPSPLLMQAMEGKRLIVPALQETPHGLGVREPKTRAVRRGQGVALVGQKSFVCADGAAGFLVSAMESDKVVLCHVASGAKGCTIIPTQTVEGRMLATIQFDDTPADVIGDGSDSPNRVNNLHDLCLFALAAELLGVMDATQAITLEYLNVRKQFGKVIGSFQALQHKAVDMYIQIEATRSLVFQVAAHNDLYDVDSSLAAAVKAQASEAAMFVTKSAIQLHGAIGFTDEHDIGLYHKRAILYASLLGDGAQQRKRYSELTMLGPSMPG